MELNNIQLPTSLVTDLYKNTLIETEDHPVKHPEKNISNEVTWKYLGNNEKNVLIIVKYNDAVHLPDEQLGFLSKLLSACKMNMGDVVIVNFDQNPYMTYKTANNHFKSKTVLLFEVEPPSFGLPLNFPHFQVQSFSGQTYLYAPSLDELEENELLKSKLWVCLRRIFGI